MLYLIYKKRFKQNLGEVFMEQNNFETNDKQDNLAELERENSTQLPQDNLTQNSNQETPNQQTQIVSEKQKTQNKKQKKSVLNVFGSIFFALSLICLFFNLTVVFSAFATITIAFVGVLVLIFTLFTAHELAQEIIGYANNFAVIVEYVYPYMPYVFGAGIGTGAIAILMFSFAKTKRGKAVRIILASFVVAVQIIIAVARYYLRIEFV
jgi:hypothetical protein